MKSRASDKGVVIKEDDTKDVIIYNIVKASNGVSSMKVNNQVASNPIGFYEESKNFAKLPCRLTHFTRVNYDKYQQGLPFIQQIDKCFKKLIPESYQKQLCKANEKCHLQIPKTCFVIGLLSIKGSDKINFVCLSILFIVFFH